MSKRPPQQTAAQRLIADGRFAEAINLHSLKHRPRALAEFAPLIPPEAFWPLAGHLWRTADFCIQDPAPWRAIWRNRRPGRNLSMDKQEQEAFAALALPIRLYKGLRASEPTSGIRWYTDHAAAAAYALREDAAFGQVLFGLAAAPLALFFGRGGTSVPTFNQCIFIDRPATAIIKEP